MRIITTTSIADTGLMQALKSEYQKESGKDITVISKGSGEALQDAKEGQADALLVHAPQEEIEFMEDGYGYHRHSFMHNYFIIVGPKDDPAHIQGKSPQEAFQIIAQKEAPFLSRGDQSGTHKKEQKIWKNTEINDYETLKNYHCSRLGMAENLIQASKAQCYTLTDESTFFALEDELDLEILVEKAQALKNVYSFIVVRPEKLEGVNWKEADDFGKWLLESTAENLIRHFGEEEYGKALFVYGE